MSIFGKLIGMALPPPLGWIVSAFGIVKKAVTFIGKLVIKHPREVAIACLLVLSWWLHRGWNKTIDQRNAIAAEYATFKDIIRDRMAEAILEATRLKLEKEALNAQLNAKADKTAGDLRIVYRDRVLRQAGAHPGCAAETNLPGADVPEGGDGPGAGSGLFISTPDALICADNTARLKAVQEWAVSMEGN